MAWLKGHVGRDMSKATTPWGITGTGVGYEVAGMRAPVRAAWRRRPGRARVCGLLGLCVTTTLVVMPVAAQEPRSVPAPRVLPGLVLDRHVGPDGDTGPKLEPIGGGRLRHRGSGFTAIVDADGSVEFRDVLIEARPSLLGFDHRGRKSPPQAGPKDSFDERALYPGGGPTAPMMVGVGGSGGGLVAALIGALWRRAPSSKKLPALRHTTAKARFLRDTEGMRMRMAHRWLKIRLTAQLDALVSELLALWRDASVPLAERKRRIFMVWDECEEAGQETGSALEQIRMEAATLARARIEALVRLLAPAGSAQQFTSAELARFNAGRRSRRAFAPYAK